MSPHHVHVLSRRRLLQFMAASPLFTHGALAQGLPPSDPVDWAPRVLAILRNETRIAMQQLGAPSLKDLTPAMVRRV
jgi:4-hydroxymandelate oxidase